jgi:hypothetical protein
MAKIVIEKHQSVCRVERSSRNPTSVGFHFVLPNELSAASG